MKQSMNDTISTLWSFSLVSFGITIIAFVFLFSNMYEHLQSPHPVCHDEITNEKMVINLLDLNHFSTLYYVMNDHRYIDEMKTITCEDISVLESTGSYTCIITTTKEVCEIK